MCSFYLIFFDDKKIVVSIYTYFYKLSGLIRFVIMLFIHNHIILILRLHLGLFICQDA